MSKTYTRKIVKIVNVSSVLAVSCQSWFHMNCAGLSKEEFDYLKELGATAFFKCDLCRQLSEMESPLSTLGKTDIKSDEESDYESSIQEVVQLLSDKVSKLITHQNNVNEQIPFFSWKM